MEATTNRFTAIGMTEKDATSNTSQPAYGGVTKYVISTEPKRFISQPFFKNL